MARMISKTLINGMPITNGKPLALEAIGGSKLIFRNIHRTFPNRKNWDFNWDGKANEKTLEDRHVVVVRHGHYNTQGKSDENRTLTQKGHSQADATGRELLKIIPQSAVKTIYFSSMTRAKETFQIIKHYFPNVTAVEDKDIAEGSPCPPEPLLGMDPDPKKYCSSGDRIEKAFRKHFHRADSSVQQGQIEYDILVCHANVTRYFALRALQLPIQAWMRLQPAHGSITQITMMKNGINRLQRFGYSSYMHPNMISN